MRFIYKKNALRACLVHATSSPTKCWQDFLKILARICERDKEAFIGNQYFCNKSDIVQSILGYQFFRTASLENEPSVPLESPEEPTHAHHPRLWPTTVNPLTSSASQTSFHRHRWSPLNVGPPSHVPCMCLPLKPPTQAVAPHTPMSIYALETIPRSTACGCLPRFRSRGFGVEYLRAPNGRTQKGWCMAHNAKK
jgi:hypothetical protein